jgi:hypothetical protein
VLKRHLSWVKVKDEQDLYVGAIQVAVNG